MTELRHCLGDSTLLTSTLTTHGYGRNGSRDDLEFKTNNANGIDALVKAGSLEETAVRQRDLIYAYRTCLHALAEDMDLMLE